MRNAFLNHHMRKFLWTFQHRTSNGVGGSDDTKFNKGYIREKTRFITLSNMIFSKKKSCFILEAHDRSLYAGFHFSNFNGVAALNFLIYIDYMRKKIKRGITHNKTKFQKKKKCNLRKSHVDFTTQIWASYTKRCWS